MNIQDTLIKENSREMANMVRDYVGDDPERMEILMDLFFGNDKRICQRASWPLTLIADNHPDLVLPYLKKMIKALDKPKHNAVVRNVVRVLQNIEVPAELEGEIYELCYSLLVAVNEPVANRVFSMTACVNIAMKYSELKDELIATIEEHMPHGSAGFKSRGRREVLRMQKAN